MESCPFSSAEIAARITTAALGLTNPTPDRGLLTSPSYSVRTVRVRRS